MTGIIESFDALVDSLAGSDEVVTVKVVITETIRKTVTIDVDPEDEPSAENLEIQAQERAAADYRRNESDNQYDDDRYSYTITRVED